jgi:hypothetical protein
MSKLKLIGLALPLFLLFASPYASARQRHSEPLRKLFKARGRPERFRR